jgi:hypothetical protein
MDHDLIVEPLLERCQGVRESLWQAPDRHRVASTSRAILAQRRQVAREMLQATPVLEAPPCRSQEIARGCPEASMKAVHTWTVSPEPVLGKLTSPVRTCQGRGCGAACRPDDAALGVPAAGDVTDAVRSL